MMRAFFKKRPDLGISIAFHLIVFFALLLFFFNESCTKEKTVYVFDMIDTSEKSPVIPQEKSKPSITEKRK